ncbi:MAG: hypothetical protein LUF29_03815 [Oscillospiraceae bacterium]|nr:hypothetical protein [Oscillospiraceae bacterium]
MPNAVCILTPEQFVESVSSSFSNDAITCSELNASGENLLLYFEAESAESCEISVEVYDSDDNRVINAMYYVNSYNSAYYVPLAETDSVASVKFEISDIVSRTGGVTISNVSLLSNQSDTIPSYLSGSYVIDENTESIELSDEAELSLNNIYDMVNDENYLYIGSLDTITISSYDNDGNIEIISSISGLGTVRRLILSEDLNVLIVASREYGVYLIDISQKDSPVIISHIDTMELASGLDVSGDYLFIASRYYGIEIYDISQPDEPTYCSSVMAGNGSECIDLVVEDAYMYVSCWGQNKVEIYNVHDVSSPEYLSSIETDGHPYGIDAEDGMLVVATGFHSTKNDAENATDLGYGLANGVSIYSLENPEKPSLSSVVRADGKYYYVSADYWNVKIINGYVYFIDLYNGLYIYDVHDITSPECILKATLSITSDSESYVDLSSDTSCFSYDSSLLVQAPIVGVAVCDGVLYVADSYIGVQSFEFDLGTSESSVIGESTLVNTGTYCYSDDSVSVNNFSVEIYEVDGQAFAIDEYEDYLYVGTSQGIYIYDKNMNFQTLVETEYAVRDLKIVGNKVYTAESLGGLGIYQIDGISLQKIGSYIPAESTRADVCNQIAVSPYGDYVVLTCRINLVSILNVKDEENIYIEEHILNTGSAYYRNFSYDYIGGDTVYLSTSSGVTEIVFDGDGYTYSQFTDTTYYNSVGGFSALSDTTLLTIKDNGYYILDVSDGFENLIPSERVRLGNDILLKGFPATKDDILVVSYSLTGQITIVDLSDTSSPATLANFYIDGNPDRAYIADNGNIYLPARYEGIVVIKEK